MFKRIKLNTLSDIYTDQKWVLIITGLIHCLIFLVIFPSGFFYGNYLRDDFTLTFFYSSQIMSGHLPYRDFPVEYPPLAMFFITLPGLVADSLSAYTPAYTVLILLFDLAGIYLMTRLSAEFNLNQWKTIGVYTLLLLATGPLIIYRFDLIPAAITLSSIFLLLKGHQKSAWGLLAAGIFTKIYPLVLAPVYLIYHFKNKQKRQLITGLATFMITSTVIATPALFLSPGGFWHSLTYHMQRGLQIESTYASILELFYAFKMIPLDFTFTSGSVNVVSPAADFLAGISFGIMAAGLVAVYWSIFNKLRKIGRDLVSEKEKSLLINYSALAILAFIITSKVFSPQFIIWLLPIIPLINTKWQNLPWLLFIMVGLMTFFIYPKYYAGIEQGELITTGMLFLRNTILIVLAFMLGLSKTDKISAIQRD